MNLNSPLFDRIRIRPAEEVRTDEPPCECPGCSRPGTHRAPKGRQREGEYFRFCIEHVREYNQAYNYFAGMSDSAVQAFQKDSITGHRPTWTIGVNGKAREGDATVLDPLGLFRERAAERAPPPEPPKPRLGKPALKALDALGLDETATRETVRTQFKTLAKRLHPDLNGGDRSREDKLRVIIDAYTYLKSVGLA